MAVLCDAVMGTHKNSVMSSCAMLRWWYDAMSCGGGVMQSKCNGLVLLMGMVDVLVEFLRAEIMMLSCLWRQNAMVLDLEAECRGCGGDGW